MHRRYLYFIVLFLIPPIAGSAELSEQILTPTSLGSIKLGMHLQQMSNVNGGRKFAEISGKIARSYCYRMFSAEAGPDDMTNIQFVGLRTPVVERIDIEAVHPPDGETPPDPRYIANRVRTRERVAIGDPVARVLQVYREDKRYRLIRTSERYVIVALKGKQRVGYAFVSDGKVVASVRAGRLAALEHQESCE